MVPGVVLPALPVTRLRVGVAGPGGTEVRYGALEESRPLPMELVIRELVVLDIADVSKVLHFVAEYGAINLPHPYAPPRPPSSGLVVGDLQLYLREAQSLAGHWLSWWDDDYVGRVWDWQHKPEFPFVERDAWETFVATINRGLAMAPPYATATTQEWDIEEGAFTVALVVGEPPARGLFTALCVQLHNMIIDGLPPQVCARCDGRFVRQRGGAVRGQHHTRGVKYCTPECARASARVAYRERQKENAR